MLSSLKNSSILALAVSFAAVFLLVWGLSWQYHKIAEQNQGKIETIEQIMEKNSAKEVLNKFMDARIVKQEDQAKIYFTENAMEQYIQNKFVLINDFKSFKISNTERLEDEKFRFVVKIQENNNINEVIEIIAIIKISDQYYINSVEIAG
jgi:hypothetical protein